MVDPKPAPVAKNVPKRADTGATDPTSYVAQDKVAPEPAIASGIQEAKKPRDIEPEIAEVIRKPASAATGKRVVDAVREAGSRVNVAIQNLTVNNGRPLNEGQRVKLVDEGHRRRTRAVKRYRGTVKEMLLSPAIRMALRSQGVEGTPQSVVDTIITEVCKDKKFAGFKVTKKGTIEHVRLTMDALIAYTLGSHALGMEDYLVDASLKYPTVFDVLVFGIAVGTMVDTIATSPVIKASIDSYMASQKKEEPSTETPAEPVMEAEPTVDS